MLVRVSITKMVSPDLGFRDATSIGRLPLSVHFVGFVDEDANTRGRFLTVFLVLFPIFFILFLT